jgi:hypothetical protein
MEDGIFSALAETFIAARRAGKVDREILSILSPLVLADISKDVLKAIQIET